MNELVKQDGTSADAAEMLINERVNKVVKILENIGYYEIPAVAAGQEHVQFGKEEGSV